MTAIEPASKPLRILIVINLEWNRHLGAVRIYMELAEQWRRAGHIVEHFSLSEAFPTTVGSARRVAIRQILFRNKAAAFVKANAERFDVIDALIGSLPVSKMKLGFTGLVVARSVGWYRTYEEFERTARRRWPKRSSGTFLGRLFYSVLRRIQIASYDSSVRHADLVNLPNEEEAKLLRRETSDDRPLVVQPYGLTPDYRRALAQSAVAPAIRLAKKTVSFVGMWAPRKGAADLAQIISLVRREVPEAQFRFLGTMVESNKVLSDLKVDSPDGIELVSEFSPTDLPGLLAECAVGAFPSYAEGFGLAILEQLAAGIPTVAFDVAGPRDILSHLPELLVPTGDVEAFAARLIRILRLDTAAYEQLAETSRKVAEQFSWPDIAKNTLQSYREFLKHV